MGSFSNGETCLIRVPGQYYDNWLAWKEEEKRGHTDALDGESLPEPPVYLAEVTPVSKSEAGFQTLAVAPFPYPDFASHLIQSGAEGFVRYMFMGDVFECLKTFCSRISYCSPVNALTE